MPSTPKKKAAKPKVVKPKAAAKPKSARPTAGAGAVQMIADGSNKVLLVFPRGAKLKGKKTLSAAQVSKMLGLQNSPKTAEVEGQCKWIHRCPPDLPPAY